jgi:hypothetical protein
MFLVVAAWCSNASATEFIREVTVKEILPIAADRPAYPGSANLVRTYVNQAAWGSSACRTDAADLQASDKHLVSVLLTAWATGRSIIIAVDDAKHPFDSVCQVTFLSAK